MARTSTRSTHAGSTGTRTKSAGLRKARGRNHQDNLPRLLDAMVDECDTYGLDYLRSSRVSAAVGLTTGALYSRFENADEMLVSMWQERVGTPFLDHLRNTVRYVVGSLPRQHEVLADIVKPSRLHKLGAEFAVVAGRNDTLAEVVVTSMLSILTEEGLTNDGDPLRGAIVLAAASAAVGTALRSIVIGTNPGWDSALVSMRSAAARATPIAHTPLTDDIPPLPINTGNPVRDALLMSAKQVVARQGFKNSTVTRIARRTGFSQSAIYSLWPDKESMLDEAIHEASVLDVAMNSHAKAAAIRLDRADAGFADSWYFGLMPSRRARLNFRLECTIAARHHAATRAELSRVYDESAVILRAALPTMPHSSVTTISAMEQGLSLGFNTLNRFVPSPQRLDYFSYMAALAKLAQ
jgi:AcrR family transcriptional regulator